MSGRERKQYIINHRVNDNGVIERRCTRCQEWFEENINNFYLMKKSEPQRGFHAQCKKCSIKRSAKNQAENPERYQEYKHNHYIEHIDMWYDRQKIYNDLHEEQNAIKEKEWLRDNPQKVYQYGQNHEDHKITKQQWIACKDYFKNEEGEWCCAYCGSPISQHLVKRNNKLISMDFHREHVDDKGANDLSNCVPSCGSCNSSKRQYPLEQWYNPNNKRLKSNVYSEERLNKILKWITEDHKQYIPNFCEV